jgi:hypothetical protein
LPSEPILRSWGLWSWLYPVFSPENSKRSICNCSCNLVTNQDEPCTLWPTGPHRVIEYCPFTPQPFSVAHCFAFKLTCAQAAAAALE